MAGTEKSDTTSTVEPDGLCYGDAVDKRCAKHLAARLLLPRKDAVWRQLAAKNCRARGVVTCHPVSTINRRRALLGKRRTGAEDFAVGHRHSRRGCTKNKRGGKCDHGLGKHRRHSHFAMSVVAHLRVTSC